MRQKETYGILPGQKPRAAGALEEVNFFCPVKGPVVQAFDPSSGHFGIDIVASENTPIKAALAGKVIQAGWSNTDGNFLVIQHHNDLATVYKHCAALMRGSGDAVKPGDVIAIIGNTGEFSHGLHLHLELWYNQSPVDPQLYISFK
jgi:murein DD-endopeptidase MepM/ murein hydrolase activator NlpD